MRKLPSVSDRTEVSHRRQAVGIMPTPLPRAPPATDRGSTGSVYSRGRHTERYADLGIPLSIGTGGDDPAVGPVFQDVHERPRNRGHNKWVVGSANELDTWKRCKKAPQDGLLEFGMEMVLGLVDQNDQRLRAVRVAKNLPSNVNERSDTTGDGVNRK